MSKGILIILIISVLTGGVIGYFSKTGIEPISNQLDLKSGTTNINWIISSKSYCDKTLGSCQNFSSDTGGTSWGSSGGGGK